MKLEEYNKAVRLRERLEQLRVMLKSYRDELSYLDNGDVKIKLKSDEPMQFDSSLVRAMLNGQINIVANLIFEHENQISKCMSPAIYDEAVELSTQIDELEKFNDLCAAALSEALNCSGEVGVTFNVIQLGFKSTLVVNMIERQIVDTNDRIKKLWEEFDELR